MRLQIQNGRAKLRLGFSCGRASRCGRSPDRATRPTEGLQRLHGIASVLVVTACIIAATAHAQLPPDEALAQLRPAKGLEVALFAAEPDLVNPTMIDVDAQGRVWVTEAANYRLFNQPETRAEGDRIRVLEDTDGDGRCDKATTFYQDPSLQAPMGIAVLGDRVYVCQAPDLFYLRDTDGDGVADEKTVVLTGFNKPDHDHSIHGVSFGPDGLLYFSNGDQGLDVTDKEGHRIHAGKDAPIMAATVLRCDLDGNRLELLAQGMRNPYEPAVDAFGNVFISDNDDDGNQNCRINYVMEGGHYGYWPKRRGDRKLEAVHWNADRPGVVPRMVRTGFGSPCGLMFYEGPCIESLRGTLVHADAGPGVIRAYPYQPDGAGFQSEIVEVLSAEGDTWFRPVDVCAAPDGSLFVADWYDPGVGGHRMGDTTRGRIYRLAPDVGKYENPPLELETPDGVAAALTSPNQARRFLGFQITKLQIKAGDFEAAHAVLQTDDEFARARALWLSPFAGEAGLDMLDHLAREGSSNLQTEAVRIMAAMGSEGLKRAAEFAGSDTRVNRQLLLEFARAKHEPWMDEASLDLAEKHDGHDRFYREAIGIAYKGREAWAYEELLKRRGDEWDAVHADLAIQLHPETALPHAGKAAADERLSIELREKALWALDAIGSNEAGAAIVAQLNASAPPELQRTALHLLARDAGNAWRKALRAADIDAYLFASLDDDAVKDAAYAFVADTERAEFVPHLLQALDDHVSDVTALASALDALEMLAPKVRRADRDDLLNAMLAFADYADGNVARQALRTAVEVPGSDSLKALGRLVAESDRSVDIRREAAMLLARSEDGSLVLLGMAEDGALPKDLELAVADRLHRSRDENIRLMAANLLPRPESREGEALPPLATLLAMRGDPAKGKAAFFSTEAADCARCHVVNGEGKLVGPELSVIGEKLGRDALLESILNPSAAVSHEYKVWVIDTFADGMLSGFIRTENEDALELVDSSGTVTTIKKDDILERRETGTSLMPDGLSTALTAQQLVDVVAYLESLK